MDPLTRRTMMQWGLAGLPLAAASPLEPIVTPGQNGSADLERLRSLVRLTGDGPSMTPPEYVDLLQRVSREDGIETDNYSRGGVVAALEERMAVLLGKERAVFLATGTLANHLAVRLLAGGDQRVAVQRDSHLYNDSGDCATVLSGLNLVPLAHGRGTFTVEELEELLERTGSGRVTTGLGVISIESPIRRRFGETFDDGEMKRVCAWARERGIRTHLDGARLFMASPYTGVSPRQYADRFDTVYVSMWKYLNAISGAILAGPAALLDDLFHTRRMFGGAMPGAWPLAAAALRSLDGFEERFAAGVRAGEELIRALDATPGFAVQRVTGGSNRFWLSVDGDSARLVERAAEADVLLPSPGRDGRLLLTVNETLARRPTRYVVEAISAAVAA